MFVIMLVIRPDKRISGLPNKRQLRLLIAITPLLIYGILVSHPIFCFEKKGVVKNDHHNISIILLICQPKHDVTESKKKSTSSK